MTRSRSTAAALEAAGTEAGPPQPLQRQKLHVEVLRRRRELSRARRDAGLPQQLVAWGNYLAARLNALRPVRVWNLYSLRHGPLMAAGSAYNMFFSVAAMLVAGFAVFGLVASGTPGLQQAIVALVSESTPGLINTGDGGFATPQQLFAHGPAFGLTLVVSSTILVLTALGWLSGLREGMRGIFGLPALAGNYFLIKLKDAGTLLLLAVALVLTSVLAVVAGSLLDLIAGWLDFDGAVASPLARATGILVMLVLDMVVAVVLFRLASGLRMNRTVMLQAALIAAAGSTVLRFFASALLAGVSRNPLLAPFAVILGLFVWFYFLSQIYLVAAAWGAVGMADVRSRDRTRDARHRATSIRQLSRRRVPGERHSRPRHARPKPAILRE